MWQVAIVVYLVFIGLFMLWTNRRMERKWKERDWERDVASGEWQLAFNRDMIRKGATIDEYVGIPERIANHLKLKEASAKNLN